MSDPTNPTPERAPEAGADPGPSGAGGGRFGQFRQMLGRAAAGAAPVARDVAAKAAGLAAVAGEKAGPVARRAAEVTGDVGTKVAERSRRFSEEMHHKAAEGEPPPADASPNVPAAADAPEAEGAAPPAEEKPPA